MSDGRVIRLDQGGDIVSEGQAYGMLVAEAAGGRRWHGPFWAWTQQHLQRPDGLLAFHATGEGTILDYEPAADADIFAAYALLRYRGPDHGALHGAGARMAAAVMSLETVTLSDGAPAVVAGTWAKGPPATIDPSYWMPPVYRALAALTGDHRWSQAADTSVALVSQVTADGELPPPDWARLEGSKLDPIPAPSGSAGVQVRPGRGPPAGVVCARLFRRRSAPGGALERRALRRRRTAAIALSRSGQVIDPSTNPLPLVVGAAARAAGAIGRADQLLAQAARQAERTSTYYGDAWLARGGALLDGSFTLC